MPWRVGKSSKCSKEKPWGVFKKGSSNPEYCHATQDGAMAQVRALYANTTEGASLMKEGEIDMELLTKEVNEGVNEKGYYYGGYVGGVVSFNDLDAARESQQRLYDSCQLNDDFSMLSQNILYSEDITDKAKALTELASEYAARVGKQMKEPAAADEYKEKPGVVKRIAAFFSNGRQAQLVEDGEFLTKEDFAWVPDPKNPSTWRIQTCSPHDQTSLVQLSKALTELHRSGAEYGIPDDKQKDMAEKILSQVEFLVLDGGQGSEETASKEASPKEFENNMSLWKESTGQYRWLAVYSNDMQDQDNPPETITEQSHMAFDHLLKEGEVPYPELWHWHLPGTRWGVADMHAYRAGFALAGGTIDPGHEKEAEELAGRNGIKVSHGMPKASVVYDPDDKSKIIFHLTKEISDLPDYAAANQATTFRVDLITKEAKMPNIADVIKEKSEYLKGLGYSDTQIQEVASRLGAVMKKEKEELHEKDGEAPPAATPPAATTAAAGDAAAASQAASEELKQEIEAAKAARVEAEALKADMVSAVKEVKDIVTDLRVIRDMQISEVKEATPRESSSFIDSIMARGNPIGSSAARIDGRSALAKDAPKEKKEEIAQVTGIPIIDQAFAGMANMGKQQQ